MIGIVVACSVPVLLALLGATLSYGKVISKLSTMEKRLDSLPCKNHGEKIEKATIQIAVLQSEKE